MIKNYNKTIISFLCLVLLFFPLFIFSQNNSESRNLKDSFGEGSVVENIADESGFKIDVEEETLISVIISTLINTILSLLGLIFVILTIISGIRWMTAAGNQEQVAKAKSALKQSLIGLFIVVTAWGFWALILRIINQF